MQITTATDIASIAKDQRENLGWSQSDFANRIGVNRRWVSEFESGKPTVELHLVLRALKELQFIISAEVREKPDDSDPGDFDLDELLN